MIPQTLWLGSAVMRRFRASQGTIYLNIIKHAIIHSSWWLETVMIIATGKCHRQSIALSASSKQRPCGTPKFGRLRVRTGLISAFLHEGSDDPEHVERLNKTTRNRHVLKVRLLGWTNRYVQWRHPHFAVTLFPWQRRFMLRCMRKSGSFYFR